MRVYFDSSALVKRGLQERESAALKVALRQLDPQGERLFSSSLAWVEVSRAIRAQLDSEAPAVVTEQIETALSGIDECTLSEGVVNIARRIAGPTLRSVDAIHLATATLIDADLVVASDERLIRSANELGFSTTSPGR
ncbi:type II toxin-antitoxin system VapC family toxin [Lacisediminihabitans sp. FW035]